MGSDSDRSGFDRRSLERTAFGKPASGADVAAAQDALRELVAQDEATASADVPRLATAPAAPAPAAEPEHQVEETVDPPVRRRLFPLIAVVGFIAVFGVGFWLGRVAPTKPTHVPNPSGSLFAEFAPSTTFQRVSTASSKSALAELAKPQTPADVLGRPDLTNTLGIETTSVHRILQVQGGLTLWTGRTTSAICLIFTGGSPASVGIGASCATPKEFDQSGLEIQENGYAWTWDGTTFGTTSTR
jgi:hypothetical protein